MDIVAKLFNIKDSTTCIFGGTLLDTDVQAGYSPTLMNPSKNEEFFDHPRKGLYLYPLIKEVQNMIKPNSFPLSMMDTWINGFAPNSRGLASPSNMSSEAAEILDNSAVLKTNQLFPGSNSRLLETMFYFFSFYGNKERILDLDTFEEEDKNKLIQKGLVCNHWLENPLPMRYLVKKDGTSNSPDYLYFIGGSANLLSDSPSDNIQIIKNLYKSKIEVSRMNLFKQIKSIWLEVNNSFGENLTSEQKIHVLKTIKLYRTIYSILFIRNYFNYALNDLGIETIIDFSESGVKKVKTKKILEMYEEVYQYCKTITLLMSSLKQE
jgi:hypothetical protein